MIISSKLKTKIYKDYDFMFSQGIMIPISIEPEAGDSIEFFEDTIKVYLAKRVSPTDSTVIMPAEEKTFFKTHLIAIEHRTREVEPLTPEAQAEWMKTLKDLKSGTIQ